MDPIELKRLRITALEATPGPWEGSCSNYPFYIDLKKPAPSLSKHDDKRPSYWRHQDAVHVLSFNPKIALELLDYIQDLEDVLEGHKNLVRELDVALNGEENAAKQASLVDLVAWAQRNKK